MMGGNGKGGAGLPGLAAELEGLRQYAGDLLHEIDTLVFHIRPSLERLYLVRIGVYEYELYKLEIAIRAEKYRIEAVQAGLNRGLEVSAEDIEAGLETELREYNEKIKAMADRLSHAADVEYVRAESWGERVAAVKSVYRSIIKRLHPDLNPGQTPREAELFKSAARAYEWYDLDTLLTIKALIDWNIAETPLTEDGYRSGILKLREYIGKLETRKSGIENSFPCDQRGLLEDDGKVEGLVGALKREIELGEKELARLRRKFAFMAGEGYAGKTH
jgi:hypothetical protein